MTIIIIIIVKCDNPLKAAIFHDKSPQVVDFNDPALEQTTVTFSRPPGMTFSGPNSSICMGNGEWEPDPRDVKCKGTKIHINVTPRCHPQLFDAYTTSYM